MLTMVRPAAVGVAASWGGVVVSLAVSTRTWHGGGGWYEFEVMIGKETIKIMSSSCGFWSTISRTGLLLVSSSAIKIFGVYLSHHSPAEHANILCMITMERVLPPDEVIPKRSCFHSDPKTTRTPNSE